MNFTRKAFDELRRYLLDGHHRGAIGLTDAEKDDQIRRNPPVLHVTLYLVEPGHSEQ